MLQGSQWRYLDEMNYNVLTLYAHLLSSDNKQPNLSLFDSDNEYMIRNTIYYYINFVYRYILQCDTLEDAQSQNHDEILEKYHLRNFFIKNKLFINTGKRKIIFSKESDITIVLEIIYKKYNDYEQLLCFERNSDQNRKKIAQLAIKEIKEVAERKKNVRI